MQDFFAGDYVTKVHTVTTKIQSYRIAIAALAIVVKSKEQSSRQVGKKLLESSSTKLERRSKSTILRRETGQKGPFLL